MLPCEPPANRRTTTADDVAFLRLVRSRRVGAASFHRLLGQHGSVAAALAELPATARAAGLTDYEPCSEAAAQAELAAGRRAGARLVRCDSQAYPAALRDLPDAPPVLWLRGNIAALARPMVAVIGARSASSLGLRMARGMAAALAEAGVTVVAGLARGIDTAAHEASLGAGTIAVFAGGIDRIYPTENAALAEAICAEGLLLSEQAPGVEPAARLFPLRNRIVSGLARAVVVVEAAHRSGTLITASCALDQGREVLAVPGHPMDARAAGCNALIRDGATLVRSAADVLAVLETIGDGLPPPQPQLALAPRTPLRPPPRTAAAPAAVAAAPLERRILALLGPSPTAEEMLGRDLGVAPAVLSPAILNLELAGQVTRLPGARIALA